MGDEAGIRCVGAVVHDAAGRLLLIRRGQPPSAGTWSLPGGRVEPGESDADAVVREVREETGLDVVPGALAGTMTREPYEIFDYRCSPRGGTLRAGDDAADARWVDGTAFEALERADALTPGLRETLRSWGCLPVR